MVVLAFTTNFQYFHDLFYLTPYFAASFPLLQELIVLDLDLEFRCLIDYSDTYIAICIGNLTDPFYLRVDVKELHNQFKMFPANAVIGVARDLDKR